VEILSDNLQDFLQKELAKVSQQTQSLISDLFFPGKAHIIPALCGGMYHICQMTKTWSF